jgi:hypothetical protein
MAVRTEALADDARKVAFLFGPAVLAGDLGPGPAPGVSPYAHDQRDNLEFPPVPVPVLILGDGPAESALVRSPDGPLAFTTAGLDHPRDVDRYTVYWDVMTAEQWRYRDAPAVIRQ